MTTAFVLGGGGVLGAVEVGMLRALFERGITPDLVTLAKGLGGGLPIGACIATGASAALYTPGVHGSDCGASRVTTVASTKGSPARCRRADSSNQERPGQASASLTPPPPSRAGSSTACRG